MELVTERDMADARAIGERAGIDHFDDWDEFIHDLAQAIADGRRSDPLPTDPACTDCGGTGTTYQTERACTCEGTR